jgi:hypothetical protein
MLGKSIMIFKFFFLNGCLIHQLIGELDFAQVITSSGTLVKELDSFLGLFFLLVDHSQVIVSVRESMLLGLEKVTQCSFCVLHSNWL